MRVLRARRLGRAAGWLIASVMLGACSAETGMPPAPTVSVTPGPSASVPADGLPLAAFGFTNGPVTEFSLPRDATLAAKVDQPNNVIAVLSSPSTAEIADYLRRSLPAGGFVITQDDPRAMAVRFRGYGWSGSFTGTASAGDGGGTSAVLLRPE